MSKQRNKKTKKKTKKKTSRGKIGVNLYKKFQKDIFLFIKENWRLTPQPMRNKYKSVARASRLIEYQEKWFEPFEKGKHISWQQCVFLSAIQKAVRGRGKRRITVSSGHGIGKTATLSWIILWYLFCFRDAQIPCTAPTSAQMHDILWKEISVWLNRMPVSIKNLYEWQTEYIRMKEAPETWFARARTARKENPEALAGVHGDHVMVVADEASGVPDIIYTTAEGALTDNQNVLFIMISNPTRLVGEFYDSHHEFKYKYQAFRFNAEDSPLVDDEYVQNIIDKYGINSDEYLIRVKGEFPRADAIDDKGYTPLLTKADIRTCADVAMTTDKRLGVDAAGEGRNKSVWAIRDNFRCKIYLREDVSDPKSIASKTIIVMQDREIDDEEIYVDNFGSGANVSKEVAVATNGKKSIIGVNFGDQADDKKRYLNKRAEAYWRLRVWFRNGGEIVDNKSKELIKQLLYIRYRINQHGRIQIMPKKEMKKEGYPSPDDADALAFTFYAGDIETKEYDPEEVEEAELYPGLGV